MFPNLTGNLSSILNIVPAPGKMTIIPIKEEGSIPIPMGPPFVLQFNPENFSEQYKPCYDNQQPQNKENADPRYILTQSPRYSLEFIIDGTGASGDKREVEAEVGFFKGLIRINSEIHRPPTLILIYGTFLSKVVMRSMDIQYTMFRSNGTPLRAKVRCDFEKKENPLLSIIKSNFLSPDLTREYQVRQGDTLPSLCKAIYDNPRFNIEVARANNLTTIRKPRVGSQLIFPPVEK